MARKAAVSHHELRNKAAQRAGFRNYYHYRKEIARPGVARLLRASKIDKGRERYELAALAANVAKLPGKPGSKRRLKKVAILSDAMRRAGGDPSRFWKPLASPKKPIKTRLKMSPWKG